MAEEKKVVYKRWQVLTGKHALNSGAIFSKGQKFITEANMNVFNTDKQKPKYLDLGEVSEAEMLKWQAEEGAKTTEGKTALPATQAEVDDTVNNAPADSLEAMTVADLKEVASDEDITLPSHATKAEIVAKIREARSNANDDD